jgi:transposase
MRDSTLFFEEVSGVSWIEERHGMRVLRAAPDRAAAAGRASAFGPTARAGGVLYGTRSGVPWRDLPPEFGKWNSVHQQYRRWTEAGAWDVMPAALADSEASDNTLQMIDSTVVLMHQHGAGGRGIPRNGIGRSRGGLRTKDFASQRRCRPKRSASWR